jgi:hypothetical protein
MTAIPTDPWLRTLAPPPGELVVCYGGGVNTIAVLVVAGFECLTRVASCQETSKVIRC